MKAMKSVPPGISLNPEYIQIAAARRWVPRVAQVLKEVLEMEQREEWEGRRRSAELAGLLDSRMLAVQELTTEVTLLLKVRPAEE
jgi:hypothetical protein